MKYILGSSSAGRKMVMQELSLELDIDFEVLTSDIDEKAIRRDNYRDLVMDIANAKADTLIKKVDGNAILIVSDQVVIYNGKIREKPVNKKEAREFLESYALGPAQTFGAVVIVDTQSGKRVSDFQTSTIHFKPLPESVISEHIGSGVSLRGAGGFVIQDPLLKPYIDHIEGTYDSAVGLSKDTVKKLLAMLKNS